MNEEFLEGKKIFIERYQKKACKNCFEKCFDINLPGLNKSCFTNCLEKYILTSGEVYNWLHLKTKERNSMIYYKIFAQADPFAVVTYDPKGVGYRLGMPQYVFAREYWGKKSF